MIDSGSLPETTPLYDVNERPESVTRADRAVVKVFGQDFPKMTDLWAFDPRPFTDAVLSAVLVEIPCPECDETGAVLNQDALYEVGAAPYVVCPVCRGAQTLLILERT